MAHSNISRRFYQNTRTPSTSGAAYHPRAQGQDNQSRPVFRNNRTPSTSGTASHTRARDQGNQPRPNFPNNHNPPTSDGAANLHQGQGSQSRPCTPSSYKIRLPSHPTPAVQPRVNSQGPKRGVSARVGLVPVKRLTDLDNDTTMTGMPFPYTRGQWRQIQRIKKCREQEEQCRLREEQSQIIDLDTVMTHGPALRQAPVRNRGQGSLRRTRQVQSDVVMLDV